MVKKSRKDYISNVESSYTSLKALDNYRLLEHHSALEDTLLAGKNVNKGDLINLLQVTIIHDLHAERDPAGEEAKFESEYARCITTQDNEFETRLNFIDTLVNYARNVGKDHINGKAIQKWRSVKKELKGLRKTIKTQKLEPYQAQQYFRTEIDSSREALMQFNLYLSQAYHFP